MGPRERYLDDGPDTFGDTELLALVLGTGAGGRSVAQIAESLLRRYDGLAGVARADPKAIADEVGIGPARAARVHAGLVLGRRALRHPARPTPIEGPQHAWQVLGAGLTGLGHEELHVLLLDRRRRPIARRALTRGSDSVTVVDPRQVYRVAIELGAAAVVLAHNHPSGDATPSRQDRDVTRRMAEAGRVLGVTLLDHLVIGDGRYVSLAEEGCLPLWEGRDPVAHC
jgi:DNA repair protein RadC